MHEDTVDLKKRLLQSLNKCLSQHTLLCIQGVTVEQLLQAWERFAILCNWPAPTGLVSVADLILLSLVLATLIQVHAEKNQHAAVSTTERSSKMSPAQKGPYKISPEKQQRFKISSADEHNLIQTNHTTRLGSGHPADLISSHPADLISSHPADLISSHPADLISKHPADLISSHPADRKSSHLADSKSGQQPNVQGDETLDETETAFFEDYELGEKSAALWPCELFFASVWVTKNVMDLDETTFHGSSFGAFEMRLLMDAVVKDPHLQAAVVPSLKLDRFFILKQAIFALHLHVLDIALPLGKKRVELPPFANTDDKLQVYMEQILGRPAVSEDYLIEECSLVSPVATESFICTHPQGLKRPMQPKQPKQKLKPFHGVTESKKSSHCYHASGLPVHPVSRLTSRGHVLPWRPPPAHPASRGQPSCAQKIRSRAPHLVEKRMPAAGVHPPVRDLTQNWRQVPRGEKPR